jgi:hypothetical protein
MSSPSQIPINQSVVLLDDRYYYQPPAPDAEWADRARTLVQQVTATCAGAPAQKSHLYEVAVSAAVAVGGTSEQALPAVAPEGDGWTVMQLVLSTSEPLKQNLKVQCDLIRDMARLSANPTQPPDSLKNPGINTLLASAHQKRYAILPVMNDLGASHLGALLRVQQPDQELLLHTRTAAATDLLYLHQLPSDMHQEQVVLMPSTHVLAPFFVIMRTRLRFLFDFVWPTVVGRQVSVPKEFVIAMPHGAFAELVSCAKLFLRDIRALLYGPEKIVRIECLEGARFPEGSSLQRIWQRPDPALAASSIMTRAPTIPENLYNAVGSQLETYVALNSPLSVQLMVARTLEVQRLLLAQMYQQQLSVADARNQQQTPERFMTWCAGYMAPRVVVAAAAESST